MCCRCVDNSLTCQWWACSSSSLYYAVSSTNLQTFYFYQLSFIFGTRDDLISLFILLLFFFSLFRRPSSFFKKAQASVVSNLIVVKFDRIVLRVNTHRSKESDFRADFTSQFQNGGIILRRKVLPPVNVYLRIWYSLKNCYSIDLRLLAI